MRVVIVALSPSIGMQFYSAGLASALVDKPGYEVWVVGSAALLRTAFHRDVRLLPEYSFPGTGPSLPTLNPAKFYSLLRQVEALHPDLIHITGPHLWNLPIVYCLRGRYPVVLTQHDAVTHKGARGEQMKGMYRRAIVEAVDCVVVHSEEVADTLNSRGYRPSATSIMPLLCHSFDYNLYQQIRTNAEGNFSYDSLAVLFGRLEEYKGVWEFIDAARLLCSSADCQIQMVVAGSGRLSDELGKVVRPDNLEIRNYVVEDAETIDLFSRAGLVVLPYSEGSQSGLIPLAYLFEKPVLVTRVGALPEYVRDNVTGRVIESNDPGTLAQAIHELLSDKEALQKMGKAGRAFLQELEMQFEDRLLETYAAVMQDRATESGNSAHHGKKL